MVAHASLFLQKYTDITAVYDGLIGTAGLYVNGKLEPSTLTGSIPPTLSTTSQEVIIGGQGVSGYNFNGQIDHVKIYDYARTPAQIAYDYNRGAPVAHWKFDECEGTVAHDASGNENHGTINIDASGTCSTSGAWANGASGKFEGSLSFDGTDDYAWVDIDNDGVVDTDGTDDFSFLDSLSAMSVSFWAKPVNTSSGLRALVSRYIDNSANRGWFFRQSTNCVVFVSFVETGGSANSTVCNAFAAGQWSHITGIVDGSTLKLYVNGDLKDSQNLVGVVKNTMAPVVFGAANGTTYYYPGQIDDVRIYNYALSPSQIQKVYNLGYGVRYGSN